MNNNIYSKIFMWMFIGLIVTFATAYYTSINESALRALFSNGVFIIFIVLELVAAVYLSARIHKMNTTIAKTIYLLYCFFSGLTFSSIFIVYKLTSITMVFGITAVLFLIFAILGKTTKLDLSKLGTYLFMMLIGVIICMIVNIFLRNTMFDLAIAVISTIVFLGFVAYDVQKIKRLEGTITDENLAIIGAFELYLDFINIFIDLLRIFGDAKD